MIKKLFAGALFCALMFTFSFQTSAKASRAARYPYIQNERLLPLALREIYDAQNIYQETIGNGNFGTFFQLTSSGLININSPYKKYGYTFQMRTTDRVSNSDIATSFSISAVPFKYRRTGRRSFHVDYLGVIRAGDKNGVSPSGDEPIIGNFPYVPLTVRSDSRAINIMRLLHSTQVTYQATSGNGNYATLEQLYTVNLIDQYLKTGKFGGYNFVVVKRDLAQGTSPAFFYAAATPDRYNLTGIRSFYVDEIGVIRGADKQGAPATVDDPPAEQ